MLFDMNYDSPLTGMFAMPDFPFAQLPRQEPINEVIFSQGCSSSNNIIIAGGNTDD